DASMTRLAVALAALRDSDHAARCRLAERACRALREMFAARMAALAPWTGDVEALAALDVPAPARMGAWEGRLDEAELAEAREKGQAERLGAEERRLVLERDALASSTGIVTDHE